MQAETDSTTELAALSPAEWAARLEEIGDEAGYCEKLGSRHRVFFSDQQPVLLVTFETVADIRARQPDQLPLGYAIASARGWSSLTIIAEDYTWFRDRAVYGYFDRLVDDAFFEDFDRVVFFGAGMAGYAAAAYAVTAPGATVIALAPQATLDPRIAGWDHRFTHMRRTSFSDRYGFAPDMLEGAGEAFVLFDPLEPMDAMHAALFRRPWVTALPCPTLGANLPAMMATLGLIEPMLVAACEGRFNAAAFWRLYRLRRNSQRYIRMLLARTDAAGRPFLSALVARNAARRLRAPRFANRLAQLQTVLADKGITLPPERPL
ncbi:MAG: phosphoadenosine phosphosulfate reductase [Rhodobacteraceae bacterium]|nr:phosphoadenosine phosphosulfate reductase [Paracoccaceae bacterium]